jgi:geranylgeranyl diphosphate synthase, type II
MTPEVNRYIALINQEIDKLDLNKRPADLYDPLRYVLEMDGKRMRPLLTLMAYTMYQEHPGDIIKAALAVEFFHNFTLMHDDIMDEAPLRRGQPTVHVKWSHNIALLSGDVMLVQAYKMLESVPDDKLGRVLAGFNQCAMEVCEGQQHDMDFEHRDNVTEEEYLGMIRQKTAVLLGYSLELGAILGGADAESCTALRNFGINIGTGFQLKDDLLDVYADQTKFGKQVGGDIIVNKKTFLLIKALEKAEGETKTQLQYWLSQKEVDKQEKVRAVTEIYDQLYIKDLAEQKMNEYFEAGFAALDQLPVANEKKLPLKTFAERLISREK